MTNQNTAQTLQTIWETLNGALYDITEGNPTDAVGALEDCIKALEALGVEQTLAK